MLQLYILGAVFDAWISLYKVCLLATHSPWNLDVKFESVRRPEFDSNQRSQVKS